MTMPLDPKSDLDGDRELRRHPDEDTAEESLDEAKNHTVAVRVVNPSEGFSVARVTVPSGDTPAAAPELCPAPKRASSGALALQVDLEGRRAGRRGR